MKKLIFILLILITFLLTTTIASSRDGRPHYYHPPYHSGMYTGPPGTWISPPVYYRSYYPPYRAHPSYMAVGSGFLAIGDMNIKGHIL